MGRTTKDCWALDAKAAGRLKLGTGRSAGMCALKIRAHTLKGRAFERQLGRVDVGLHLEIVKCRC